jgi:hypothetical protein
MSSKMSLCLSDWLRRELAIGTRRSVERAVQDAKEELRFLAAAIEPKHELVQVALEVFLADSVKGAPEPGLQIPEDRVRPRQKMNGLVPVPPPCVADGRSRTASAPCSHPRHR